MKSQPRYQEQLPVTGLLATFTTGWKNWFGEVFSGLGGWSVTIAGSGAIDFGNIPVAFELSGTATVSGASVGDMVNAYPMSNIPGVVFVAIVTATDTVTVYAKNVSSDLIDPPPIDFKFIIFKN